jgi:hypothetical protein
VYTALENQLYLDEIIARFANGLMKPAAKAAIAWVSAGATDGRSGSRGRGTSP